MHCRKHHSDSHTNNAIIRHQENPKHSEWDTASMCPVRVVGRSYGHIMSCKKENHIWFVMANCLCAHLRDILVCISFVFATLQIINKTQAKQYSSRHTDNFPLQLQPTQYFVNTCILCLCISWLSCLQGWVLISFYVWWAFMTIIMYCHYVCQLVIKTSYYFYLYSYNTDNNNNDKVSWIQ